MQLLFDFDYVLKWKNGKIVNLLDRADSESSKFATRKWYVINNQNNTDYDEGNEDGTTVKFQTIVIVTTDIAATGGNVNTRVVFKNCAPFTKCTTHINDKHADDVNNLAIIMPMYNLIEYSDNYSDSSGSSWIFKRD